MHPACQIVYSKLGQQVHVLPQANATGIASWVSVKIHWHFRITVIIQLPYKITVDPVSDKEGYDNFKLGHQTSRWYMINRILSYTRLIVFVIKHSLRSTHASGRVFRCET